MQRISLKEAEKRAFKSTHQDGLWDMYLGAIFLAFGLGPLLRNEGGLGEGASMVAYLVYIFGLLVIWLLAKKYITAPRIGLVKFGTERKRKLLNMRVVLMVSCALGVVIWLLFASDNPLDLVLVLSIFSANILIVLGLMAYFMDFERLYGYAAIWAASLPLGEVLNSEAGLGDAGYVFLLTGSLPIIIGAWLFVRFLHDYPLPPDDRESMGLANGEA